MGVTTKMKEKKNLKPVEMKETNKNRLHMSKAQVLEENRIAAEKKRKIEEYKRKLEENDGLLDGKENDGLEEVQKKQEGEEVLSPANAAVISGSQSPLVKRGRPRKDA